MTKGFGHLLKQAQEMHKKISALQEEMRQRTVEATAGGGMVTVTANGKNEVLSVKIDPEVVNRDDVEMLEDLVLAAVNEALRRVQEMTAEEMRKLTGGIQIPGLF